MNWIDYHFGYAISGVQLAIVNLDALAERYAESDLEDKEIRIAALQRKINALNSIMLDPQAYPWRKDNLSQEETS